MERTDSNTEKGGVALYIDSEVNYVVRKDFGLNVDSCEDLWVEIKSNRNTNSKKMKRNHFLLASFTDIQTRPIFHFLREYATLLKN